MRGMGETMGEGGDSRGLVTGGGFDAVGGLASGGGEALVGGLDSSIVASVILSEGLIVEVPLEDDVMTVTEPFWPLNKSPLL